jgi:hypothetical protein
LNEFCSPYQQSRSLKQLREAQKGKAAGPD